MTTQTPIRTPTAEGLTERVDSIAFLDESTRRKALTERPSGPGRFLEVQGPGESLLIPLGTGVMHIGRGLSADLHLDEKSVSRRHAMLVHRPTGPRLLDDRSSNGTFVNGRRIVQADLHNGDVLVLGRVVLRYLEM
ncbi:MAG TPA: FHA domain-containing protein [Solirubrobacteraceae bacterium]|jgi:pSer/pThr/pTyr-binding forkhead associated (FHA) protein|nr:FHA domain-containing protein [Solirubrobacteraceae bacterium]